MITIYLSENLYQKHFPLFSWCQTESIKSVKLNLIVKIEDEIKLNSFANARLVLEYRNLSN